MRVGSYELVREVGRGAMGAVFEARDASGRQVAVKVLLRSGEADLARFERERRLLSEFGEEEGVVPLLDSGTHSSGAWVVMPFYGGGTLRQRLKRGPLPVEEAIALGRTVARALGRCHARGIVHRDLKPENVLFATDGRAILSDLGLAKHYRGDGSRSASLSRTGELRGTLGYSAPEQLENAKDAGPRSDVFALGAILYECLTGREAFPGETMVELVEKIRAGKFEPLARACPDAPQWLVSVVERALSRAPGLRHADGEALAEALESARGERGRGRLPAVAIGLVAVAAIAAAAVTLRPAPATSASSEGKDDAQTEKLLAEVDALVARGDLESALARATRAVAVASGSARAHAALGRALIERLEYGKAEEALARATALDASLARAWGDRACAIAAYVASSSAAREYAERAIALAPDDASGWVARAAVRATDDVQGSLADATRATRLAPGDPRAWCAVADSECAREGWAAMIGACQRALDLAPGHPLALTLRGLARMATDPAGARADLDRAIERAPRASMPRRFRAALIESAGDRAGSLAELRAAVEGEPRDARAWADLGAALDDAGQVTESDQAFERAILLAPDEPRPFQTRGAARVRRTEYALALVDYERWCQLAPRSASAWGALGGIYLAVGRAREAAASYERQTVLDPAVPQAWHGLGESLFRLDQMERALASFDKAIALAPGDAPPYLTRAKVRDRLGDLRGSIEDLARYVALAPPDAPELEQARARLAQLEASRGR